MHYTGAMPSWRIIACLSLALSPSRSWAQDAGSEAADAGYVGEETDAGVGEGRLDGGLERAPQPPRILKAATPEFPDAQRGLGLHPNVVLEVTVDAHGEVVDATVVRSAGEAFDAAALQSIRQWEFAPALVDGETVSARIRVAVHFREDEPGSSVPPSADDTPPSAPKAEDKPLASPAFEARAEAELESMRTVHRGAGDLVLDSDVLRAVPRAEGADLLRSAPGVYIARTEGEGVAHRISLRGFDADHGQDLELRVEGIPINRPSHIHGQGYADLGFLIADVIDAIEVKEGVYDPQQGDFAIAGSINFRLASKQRGWALSSGYGSFSTFVQRLLWAPEDERDETFGVVQYKSSDGFGQNRSSESASAIVQANLGSGAWRFQPTLIAAATRADLAGVVRQDDVDTGRVGFYQSYPYPTAQSQNASAMRALVGARAEYRGAEEDNAELGVWLGADNFRLQENFTGFVQRSRWLEGVTGLGDLIEQRDNAFSGGLWGRYRSPSYEHYDWLATRLELGVDGRYDDISQAQNLIYAVRNETWDRRVDAEISAMNLGLWADVEIDVTKYVALHVGARGNFLSYAVDDKLGNFVPSTRDRDESILGFRRSAAGTTWGPRLSAAVKPTRELTLLAAYGQGFRSPQARTLEDGESAPFTKVHSWDIGARLETEMLSASISGFWTELSDDVAFEAREGRLERIGATRRRGVALFGRVGQPDALHATASLTYVQAQLLEPPPPTADEPQPAFEAGQAMPYVPPLVARLDLLWQHELGEIEKRAVSSLLAFGGSLVSERPLPHGQSAEAFALVDASAKVAWWHFSLTLDVFNVFDAQYAANVYNFASNWEPSAPPSRTPAQHISAGAPRTFMLTLGVKL